MHHRHLHLGLKRTHIHLKSIASHTEDETKASHSLCQSLPLSASKHTQMDVPTRESFMMGVVEHCGLVALWPKCASLT